MAEEIEILGLGPNGLAVGMGPHTALVPMPLLEREMMEVTKDGAEEWAAAQRFELAQAIGKLVKGEVPPAPFDGMVLEAEA
ncbi:hypothetical protein J4E08_01395 [Sagittula sp. NFXS13]|uniref:Uncharacterized protein n=1 Tax=Sagittula marina TaxID=943940 RepID=A0A7W6GS95_9RHOB|nr:hypothetical protein [Sagittula marina]MBB3985547.1 hypothetical protein [Sagittula marina]